MSHQYYPHLGKGKLRHREAKWHVQTANKWQTQDSNVDSLAPETMLLTLILDETDEDKWSGGGLD